MNGYKTGVHCLGCGAKRVVSGRAEDWIQVHGDEHSPAANGPVRSWDLPPEPGPEVTAVRDVDGDEWAREMDGWIMPTRDGIGYYAAPWRELLQHAPLVDVTPEAKP